MPPGLVVSPIAIRLRIAIGGVLLTPIRKGIAVRGMWSGMGRDCSVLTVVT